MVFKRPPIADIRLCCQSALMKPITHSLCFIVASIASPAIGQNPDTSQKLLSVSGYLDGHWEYPSFVPDSSSGLNIMDFNIKDKKWLKVFDEGFEEEYKFRPDTRRCFRIIGKGYLEPRQISFMQPWNGSQFVFVEISKLKRLKSGRKCDSDPTATVR